MARADATVTVPGTTVLRHGKDFAAEVSASGTGALLQTASVTAHPPTDSDHVITGSRAVPAATESPVYDADGNLLQTSIWTYTWDAENRLIRAESKATVTGMSGRSASYSYDDQWRLIARRITNPDTGVVLEENRRTYDGWNLIAEFDRVGCRGLRPGTLPHHRTCGFLAYGG